MKAIELLKKIEWLKGGWICGGVKGCYICGNLQDEGHKGNCKLAQVFAELEKQPVTENPDVQRLIIQLEQYKARIKELEDALIDIGESLRTKAEIHRPEPLVKPTWFCLLQEEHTRLEILISRILGKSSLDAMKERQAALKGDKDV